ncbi:MAG: 4-hydroxy-tetrahydrodipicolinate reductase [Alistipes sp.]|nr:4-hydroxy-tetrahydrodipicolinate reductase [Alistipes sp.]
MKTAIIGYGKMGREIERILIERGHSVDLVIDIDNAGDLNEEKLKGIDVAIEFTTPATGYNNVVRCIECGVPVVSGTTGWTSRLEEVKNLCQERGGALFYTSNYSLGVNFMFRLNRKLAEMMNTLSQYDVRIEEVHHIQKKDAPSGTAISLADDITARLDRKDGWNNDPEAAAENEIAITSLREGMIAGIHTVTYESADDILELRHTIKNRSTLAAGAVAAAEFLCGKQGFYTMDDLLG